MFIAFAIIFILILIYYFTRTEDYLYGFWSAENDEFCEKSEIESILLFIGKPEGYIFKTRQAYLIIMNDMANDALEISYREPLWDSNNISAKVTFDEEQIWPENVTFQVDPFAGTLKIHADDVVYAQLYKQHETTNMALTLEE